MHLYSTLVHHYSLLQVPSLKTPSPALYSSTREAAVSHISQATTYLASFTLAQLALKVTPTLDSDSRISARTVSTLQASDSGLETADSLLKLVPVPYSSQCEPLASGLKRIREEAAIVRKEGATKNGSQKVCIHGMITSLCSEATGQLVLSCIFFFFC